jgi:chromosome segregation ATPase
MDLNQASQMINWLEAERKKDKAALSTLLERVQGLSNELADQSKRMQELREELAATQLTVNKLSQFDRLFAQLKADLVGEMDRRGESYQKALREAEQMRKVDLEASNRTLADVRKELPRIKPLEDEMPMRRAEERRLSEQQARTGQRVEDLAARTEERIQNMIFLEEGRRQDSKRIAQLEEGSASILKRIEAVAAKTVLLDENMQRIPPRIVEIAQQMSDQDKVVEEMRLNDFRRSQEMKGFVEDVGKLVDPLPDFIATSQFNLQRIQELGMANQHSLDEIQGFQNRIEKRQSEVSEMQRISEDRMKKQVEEWQAEQEKRWKRQILTLTEQWQEHDRLHGTWEARVEQLEQASADYARQFKVVWDGLDEFTKVYLSAARQVVETEQATLEKGRPSKVILTGEQVAAARKA